MTTPRPSGTPLPEDVGQYGKFKILPVQPEPFGPYTLVAKLGHGRIAELFLGLSGQQTPVAIKRLFRYLEDDRSFVALFLDEVRLSIMLRHENIVRSLEAGEIEGAHFFAMEYLEGQGLDRVIRRCTHRGEMIPTECIADIFVETLQGLHYAHELTNPEGHHLGVVHRDISPWNLFITYDGGVKILDFGIARAAIKLVETRTGLVKGRLGYMAPEQLDDEQLDRRADIWSLGAVLWEAAVGSPLFQREEAIKRMKGDPPEKAPNPSEISPGVSNALSHVIRKALSSKKEDRYQKASEMHDDLKDLCSSTSPEARRANISEFLRELFADTIPAHQQLVEKCIGSVDDNTSKVPKKTSAPPVVEEDDLKLTKDARSQSKGPSERLIMIVLAVIVVAIIATALALRFYL